ncbi:chromosome segregation protein [Mesobacillus persicus]|uniref:Nuclease SbcCD subunit C n=1 Tax=Mesobacillus persicus TaxID=930146 RepID=A0A1H8AS27_9BACI|nr:AAA family ATPase [Mesobacillus persicus]SEM73520.1 chromosome segregation protein [Mesobacillus persicus]
MIPWRLTFSGVRDYPPTLIDLSGEKDHVMITGPNGAGKSTITFCMGAVLYSSKVDVEGLKSRNLPPDETWKAKMTLLFCNEGVMKIDAPSFVEFSLRIIQEPGQPIKKEFSISSGDIINNWDHSIRYTSGDRFYNFTAYKKDLQYKYKVDPDLFYLIWYQQEVNQFAVMNPEERFRIFSQMHGIDKVQRDWEESMEKVKETEETLKSAESNVKFMKAELSLKKNALDRFLANQKRLTEGGKLYIGSLLQLEVSYKKEIERLGELVEQLEGDLLDAKDDLVIRKSLMEKSVLEIETYKTKRDKMEVQIESDSKKLAVISDSINQIQSRLDVLDQELETITERKNKVTRTEKEVNLALDKLTEVQKKTNFEFAQNNDHLNSKKDAVGEAVERIAKISHQVEIDRQAEKSHLERLRQYQSSHAVQQTIDSLNAKTVRNRELEFDYTQKLNDFNIELSLLNEDRDLSARQIESMKYFQSQQIKAFALRELIELNEGAKIKDEHLYNSIKYTIFYDGKQAAAPNDLYHVPLKNIIPDRMITELPLLQIRVKDGISEEVLPCAIKALWWIEQFFKDKSISIKNGLIIDPMGIRGSQEKNRYILSVKALRIRMQEVKKLIEDYTIKLSDVKDAIAAETKSTQELNSIIHQVRESEAFMVCEQERIQRKKKLAEEIAAKAKMEEEVKELEKVKDKLVRLQIEHENLERVLKEEASIYEELGKMKDKYEERNRLQKQLDNEKHRFKSEKRNIELLEDNIDELKRTISTTDRQVSNMVDAIEGANQSMNRIENQKSNKIDEMDSAKLELVNVIEELSELKTIVAELYSEVAANVILERIPSVVQIKNNRENGKVTFDHARTEPDIDPAAQENYQTVKQEYERLESEYKRTNILLEQDKERMENLKDQLETTINMRVLELQQRFKSYMSQFQFEGEISWESYEDRKKRTHFHLYIKARKEGHRGAMEDVSIKARGGKVGKGVSGGEESLSSLLFALALLQNLQTSPGFIVLDEFDSALDENRKAKVFDLYVQELKRKLIILTPKSHEETYLNKFSKAFVVQHDPTIPKSKVVGIVKKVSSRE